MMKNVLITGASRGVGFEVAKRFVAAGWRVFVLSRNLSKFEMEEGPGEVEKVAFDLKNVEYIPELVDSLPAMHSLVNNAGIMNAIPHDEYPAEKARELMTVNLEAPVALMREVSKGMSAAGGGRIVNNASLAAHIGLYYDVWYGISKAGLVNATKAYAKLLGTRGIAVNCVAPGPIETDMLDSIPRARQDAFKYSVPSGRFAKSAEVADVVFWLAAEAPTYMTGVCVDINNGALMR